MNQVVTVPRAPNGVPYGRPQLRPYKRQWALKRMRPTGQGTLTSSRGRFIRSLPFFRLLGPVPFLVAPNTIASGEYPAFAAKMWRNEQSLKEINRLFQKVELESGSVFLSRLSSSRDTSNTARSYERGYWKPLALPALTPDDLPAISIEGGPVLSQPDVISAMSHVTDQRMVQHKLRFAEQHKQARQRFDETIKRSNMLAQTVSNRMVFWRVASFTSSPYVGPSGAYPFPPPNPALYWHYVHQNGVSTYVFNEALYNSDLNTWQANVFAHETQIQHAQAEHAAAEQARYDEVLRVQGVVKRNSAAHDFVITQQPTQKTEWSAKKSTRRKNDKKNSGMYNFALALINNTYGRADEAYEYVTAFIDNLDPVGDAPDGNWDAIPIGGGKFRLVPVTYAVGLRMYIDGSAELDWHGFFVDVAKNAMEDIVIGTLSKGVRDLSRLTDRPVGLTAGPAF